MADRIVNYLMMGFFGTWGVFGAWWIINEVFEVWSW